MTIINKLASSLNRRDEVPNQELAKQIANKSDKHAVKELVDNLSNKNNDIQNDCIKVLYEIGERKPSLIAGYAKQFSEMLTSKNNRLQWGGMTALNTIALENPKLTYSMLPKIVAAADSGSVITRDHAVKILIKLCSIKQYSAEVFPLLVEQLMSSPTNQMPTYAENMMPLINDSNKKHFVKTLTFRLPDFEQGTKRKRLEKVIKKFS